MDQQIGFCTTSDGVNIAYATLGEGPPLVYVTGWPGHLSLEWEKPFSREFLHALAGGVTLVRYDMRGSGLSDKDVSDFSLDRLLLDLEAVVDRLQLEQFTLLSLGLLAGPLAISYAATKPERITRLVMIGAYLRGSELTTPERRHAMIHYVSSFGLPESFVERDVDKWRDAIEIRKGSTPDEVQGAVVKTMFDVDVSEQVDGLSMPILIMHGQRDGGVPFALGRNLAARLPHARFVPFDGGAALWQEQDVIIPEIRRFLGVEVADRAAEHKRPSAAGAPVTILFTDMESSTALTQRLGDAKAQELVRAHNTIVREGLQAHGGTEIKHTGDGIMASFAVTSGALECAIAIQRGLADLRQAQADQAEPLEATLNVRIGLNAGEPVAEEDDLFGTAVQFAARICDHAEPGQILVSDVVRQLVAGKDFLFSDRGEVALRG
ncbi:MAG: adenylate/guanylate cyclase domain-containing protein, partial [Chloroflexi bacterium]|nr:adenylate/guanylate cyclase domain-containing protein [Chloroflexota bacterium]